MPTLEWLQHEYENIHHWEKQGDEWDGYASYSNKPYSLWKQSVIENFIIPYVDKHTTALEYGVGEGRWTEPLLLHAQKVIGVDICRKCIDVCKAKFASYKNGEFLENNGTDISFIPDESIDFVWSFATFPQIEINVIRPLLLEFQRVMKKGAKAIIHHAARRHSTLWLGPHLNRAGFLGKKTYQIISMAKFRLDDGDRSNTSNEMILDSMKEAGFTVVDQRQSWGKDNEFHIKLYRDMLTTVVK